MDQNILPPEAAPFKPCVSKFDTICISSFLVFLMASHFRFLSLPWALTVILAVILSFMVREDAYEQTVDVRLLSALGTVMLFISVLNNSVFAFLKHMIIGVCFFRFLLAVISLWLSCRSVSVAVPSEAWDGGDCLSESNENSNNSSTGYLPIFTIVFVIHLGFGEDFAPYIFHQAAFMVDIITEIIEFYSALPYICVAFWLLVEAIIWWMEHVLGRQILWAFGGGDVLFLGLFAGYLGLSSLFSLFFLSLIARAVFSIFQFFVCSRIAFS